MRNKDATCYVAASVESVNDLLVAAAQSGSSSNISDRVRFKKCWFLRREENRRTQEKLKNSRIMMSFPGLELRPQWRQVSASQLSNAHFLLPKSLHHDSLVHPVSPQFKKISRQIARKLNGETFKLYAC